MAWSFGDSFDLYAAAADMTAGYWDTGGGNAVNIGAAGRFSGSRGINVLNSATALTKTSGVNDAVHHFVLSINYSTLPGGTTSRETITLYDGATAQCCISFRTDGAIILQSGSTGGATLATYTGAIAAINTWYAFEFEVVINNAAGAFAVRKNGNSVNDFNATSLNTRGGTANNYANKIIIGNFYPSTAGTVDDLFWQSGAAAGAWLGDIRCYARAPASDMQKQFSQFPASPTTQVISVSSVAQPLPATNTFYIKFVALATCSIASAVLSFNAGATGTVKSSIFDATGSAGAPGQVLGSAGLLTNPVTGNNTVTFASPVAVTFGTTYYFAISASVTITVNSPSSGANFTYITQSYAAFPIANPGALNAYGFAVATILNLTSVTPLTNANLVSEAQPDGLTTYVYDSSPGDADFYSVASIASTPAVVIATTVRGYMQKSDAGARTAAVQLKSGGTTVASPTLVLTTPGFLWVWRTDLTDPATGAAWTPAAVNNAQIGPKVIA